MRDAGFSGPVLIANQENGWRHAASFYPSSTGGTIFLLAGGPYLNQSSPIPSKGEGFAFLHAGDEDVRVAAAAGQGPAEKFLRGRYSSIDRNRATTYTSIMAGRRTPRNPPRKRGDDPCLSLISRILTASTIRPNPP